MQSEIESKMGGLGCCGGMRKPCPALCEISTSNFLPRGQVERTLILNINSISPAKDTNLLSVQSYFLSDKNVLLFLQAKNTKNYLLHCSIELNVDRSNGLSISSACQCQ